MCRPDQRRCSTEWVRWNQRRECGRDPRGLCGRLSWKLCRRCPWHSDRESRIERDVSGDLRANEHGPKRLWLGDDRRRWHHRVGTWSQFGDRRFQLQPVSRHGRLGCWRNERELERHQTIVTAFDITCYRSRLPRLQCRARQGPRGSMGSLHRHRREILATTTRWPKLPSRRLPWPRTRL